MSDHTSRRTFLEHVGIGSMGTAAAAGLLGQAQAQPPGAKILGAAGCKLRNVPRGSGNPSPTARSAWGSSATASASSARQFGFQDHPNVTVAAVSDLFPDRCRRTGQGLPLPKTYPSLEELVKDDSAGGGLRGHRRPQPRPALHRRAAARQARGLARCRQFSARSKTPTSCSRRSSRAAAST